MKNFFILMAVICLLAANVALAQNMGIGTTSPQEKLDVAGNVNLSGRLSMAPQVLAAANAISGDANRSVIIIQATAGVQTNVLTLTGTPSAGQMLYLTNLDGDAVTFGSASIPSGETRGFLYRTTPSAGWTSFSATGATDNMGNHTATQNLSLGGNWLSGDGGNEGLSINSTGKVGVNTSTPGGAFQVNTPMPAGTASLDANTGVGTSVAYPWSSTQVNGQSFLAGTTGVLASVDFVCTNVVYLSGSYQPQSATLSVYSGAGYGGTLLGTQNFTIPGNQNAATINVPISAYIPVSAGSVYTIKFSTSSTISLDLHGVTDGTIYSNGAWHNNAGSSSPTSYDLLVKTYVKAVANSPTFYVENGFVGIGTTSPSAALHVNGDARIGAYTLPATDGTNGQALVTDGIGTLSWRSNIDNLGSHTATQNIVTNGNWLSNDGTNAGVFVDNAGNVGIGTASPGARLHVNGGLRVGAYTLPSTDGTNGQVLATNGTGTLAWSSGSGGDNMGTHTATQNINLGTNYLSADGSNEGLQFDAANNVTVTTGAPAGTFKVVVPVQETAVNDVNTNAAVTNSPLNSTFIGQSFVISTSGFMTQLRFGYTNNSGGNVNVVAKLFNGAGITGTTAIPNTTYAVPAGSNLAYTITFASPVAVTAGDVFTIAFYTFGANFFLRNSTANPYAGGNVFLGPVGSPTTVTGTDLDIDVFVTPITHTPAISANGSANVGIGTATPTERLEVNGNAKVSGTLQVGTYTLPAADGSLGQYLNTNGAGTLSWTTVPGDNLGNHTATQNLSIGSHLLTGGGSNGISMNSNGNAALNLKTLYLRDINNANHGLGYFGPVNGSSFAGNANLEGPVLFGWSGGALGSTDGGQKIALHWDNSQNVGIGTTASSSYKLDINGNTGGNGYAVHVKNSGHKADGMEIEIDDPYRKIFDVGGTTMSALGIQTDILYFNSPNFYTSGGSPTLSGSWSANNLSPLSFEDSVQADEDRYPHWSTLENSMADVSAVQYYLGVNAQNEFIRFTGADGATKVRAGGIQGYDYGDYRRMFNVDWCALAQSLQSLCSLDPGEIACGLITNAACTHESDITFGVSYTSGGADYAEYLQRKNPNEMMNRGDIVGVKEGKISKNTEGVEKLMVISSRPIVLGNVPEEGKEHLYEKVAFLGQADIRVRGQVKTGDYILPSGKNDGHGYAVAPAKMTAADFARVVGRAWANNDYEGAKWVNCIVGLDNNSWAEILQKQQAEIQALKEAQTSQHASLQLQLDMLKAEMGRMSAPQTASNQH